MNPYRTMKPEWILNAETILKKVRLDRFPCKFEISHETKCQENGRWLIMGSVLMLVRDRQTGAETMTGSVLMIEEGDDPLRKLLKCLDWTLRHEIRECFQFEEADGTRSLPFDPHPTKAG
ncbi:unnamed protein product [Sphagnum jensenii]